MTAQIKLPPNPAELIATVRTLQDAVEVFRTMKDRLGLTNEFIDEVGGLVKGHADKVLGRSEQKRLGYDTFALFMRLFAIEFRVHIDMAAVKDMEAVWEERKRPSFPHRKPGRVCKKLVDMARPHVIRDFSRAGGTASGALRTGSQGSEVMRKLAKARWSKRARKRRYVAETKGPATLA